MTDLLKPSFVIAFLMLLGAALLCWLGKVSEAGHLTITLAVGAGFGLSTQTAREAIRSAARGLQ